MKSLLSQLIQTQDCQKKKLFQTQETQKTKKTQKKTPKDSEYSEDFDINETFMSGLLINYGTHKWQSTQNLDMISNLDMI